MSHPITDIIVLVYNQFEVTRGFVKHLYENTDNGLFNLIFVDNGSTDATVDFLKDGENNKRWKVIRPGSNLGIIKGRNLGAKSVTSDYFVNIDNDQYPGPGWLKTLHSLMSSGYDIVGCEAWALTPPGAAGGVVFHTKVLKKCYYPKRRCSKPDDTFTYIGCGGMLIKRAVYDNIGLFDERFGFAYFEDPDFSMRAIQAGYKLGWAYNCPIKHLAHQTLGKQLSFDKNEQFYKSFEVFQNKWYPYYPEPISMNVKRSD